MRAIISVIGQDRVGILNRVSGACAECNANIVDVTQSVLQDMFVMVMLVDITDIHRNGYPRNARGYFQFHAPHLRVAIRRTLC